MLDKKFNYAVVGASADTSKYGYKLLLELHEGGYRVFPINQKAKEICDLQVHNSLESLSITLSSAGKAIDAVVFVVPPQVTLTVLEHVKKLGIRKVWMQPGSFDDECIAYCKKNEIEYIADACIMIEKRKL